MKKTILDNKVAEVMLNTRYALQVMYNSLNYGQQKQIVKNSEVKALFDRYGVEYTT